MRSLKTNKAVVQQYPMQFLSLRWDQLSRLSPQLSLPLIRHQESTEVRPQTWSLTRRQPLCPRLPIVSLPLHWQQPHAQWGDQGELTVRGHTNIRGCSGSHHMTTTLASHNNATLTHFLLLIRHDERRGLLSTITWWIYNRVQYLSWLFIFPIWPVCLPAVTSAWYSKDTLRRETRDILIPKTSSSICLLFINFRHTAN